MVKFETVSIPAADIGPLNPMPDIKNVSYIHADYELSSAVTEEEKKYMGKGMIPTIIPYKLQDGYNRDRKMRDFQVAVVENEHLRAEFIPELGGRLRSLYDKDLKRELLYVNPIFQPGNLGIRNAWFCGGVEFNVGIKGHNTLTCSPLWCSVDKTSKGDILRFYEYERIRGVVYSISAWIPENSNTLYLRCRIENKSNETKNMYWWSNIAVPETKHTRVLVPADDSFLCFYNEDHYYLDKASIPCCDDVDVSYPSNIASSRDFFYKIPENERKWIAAVEKDGYGLLQCSTRRLMGRKLFVWGQGRGGKNWNEWLAGEGASNIEIQAGLAHTQLEHIPMKANDVWEWTEAYTAMQGDPDILHGDYNKAIGLVDKYMFDRVGDPNDLTFPADELVTESKIVCKGSDWGAVEEMVRGGKISDTFEFEPSDDEETRIWKQLLETNTFPSPSVYDEPVSYVSGDFWLNKLKNLKKPNWYSLLHIGVIYYAKGDLEEAKCAWEASLNQEASPWALRNLSMLYKNELNDLDKAREYILKAFEMKKDCSTLCKEVAMQLTLYGNDEMWIEIYERLLPELKNTGRLRLYKAIALIHLDRLEEATEIINENFVLYDIKEGELSVSYIWFELYRKLYAKETGKTYDENDLDLIKEADEKYPLPKKLDFRMHKK